jgi:hypothetical protein
MKKLIFVLMFIAIAVDLFSQELKYSDLNSTTRPQGPFKSYVSKDGAVYKVGDTLKIGFPSSNKTFAFIEYANGGTKTPAVNSDASNTKTEIKSIVIGGNKKSSFFVAIKSNGSVNRLYGSGYYIQLENAIEVGEIKTPGLSSDEALIELKKAKDKLDLQLIPQSKYDSIKAVLVKYIKL